MENRFTAFRGTQNIAEGTLEEVALRLTECEEGPLLLVFEDNTGKQVDLDLRGTPEEILARLAAHPYLGSKVESAEKKGPGRPKLGVMAREVTLLPRHWEWLNAQPGGASVALRKLVEEASKKNEGKARRALEALSRVMWSLGGNLPRFEEASRALTRKEYERFENLLEDWPEDIRGYVLRLLHRAIALEEVSGG